MTPKQADTIVRKTVDMLDRDKAFHAALIELFRAHPVEEWRHEMYHAMRESVLRKAQGGGYRRSDPRAAWKPVNGSTMKYWRDLLGEREEELLVPAGSIVTIHLLVYGDQ